MATDLATLAIRIESLEAVVAKQRLDRLSASGKKTEKQNNALAASAKKLGGALAGVFAAGKVIGKFAEASKVAATFEASISELSAITGATGKDLDYLSEKAKIFGRTTTLSASQAAEAFKLVASAKPDLLANAEALAAVSQRAITLAEATGSTLPQAADTLGQAMNQFGVGAEEADRFINVLAAGAQKGASFVNETAEALKYAGTVASSFNVTFEETNAVIQQLSTVGIKGSEAGAALRQVFMQLEQQANDQFKPSMVGLNQALDNLRTAGYDQTGKAMDIFNVRSVVAATTLIKNADAVDTLEEALTGTQTAFEQQKTKIDNYEGALKNLASAQEGLAIRIGDEMNPLLRDLAEEMTKVTNAYTSYLGGRGQLHFRRADDGPEDTGPGRIPAR